MPNLLAIDCPDDFALQMAGRGDWSVAVGFHGGSDVAKELKTSLRRPPDPMVWNVVVDDCEKQNDHDPSRLRAANIPLLEIPNGYLRECERAHGIRLCSAYNHTPGWEMLGTMGHRDLEFNPTDDVRATHLSDFIDEFAGSFVTGRISSGDSRYRDFALLFLDAYKSTVVAIEDRPFPWLVMINIPDDARRAEALEYLATRTAPKLWGDLQRSFSTTNSWRTGGSARRVNP